MTTPGKPLRVDPRKLHETAGQLDAQGSGFQSAHDAAQSRAGHVDLGSGQAGAALPGMLAAWEADATRFGEQFAKHAQAHRAAADGYVRTDAHGASTIDDTAPAP
ncbi:WXG100 family type VII secretion target [Mycobacterium hubeiense]|uniref:WXG100 family type VII secretion target n=1 Tax=Mycobacterium hubeiense TaxID=1867256 RepID=UPI000C7E9BFF|nr:type VII secretion target [Mycobacterium sp. QGD 101]